MSVCHRYLISGRVQGVFYRASAHQQATRLGLNGWVRNLMDGRVELLACGEISQLEQLHKWLETGPDDAKVTNIEVIRETGEDSAQGFAIRSTQQ